MAMPLTGQHFIGAQRSAMGGTKFHAKNPATGETLKPSFSDATTDEIDFALRLADEAFEALQPVDPPAIAALLDSIAAGIEAAGEPLLERAHAETALPMPRLRSERDRTAFTTRLFADLVRGGSWV